MAKKKVKKAAIKVVEDDPLDNPTISKAEWIRQYVAHHPTASNIVISEAMTVAGLPTPPKTISVYVSKDKAKAAAKAAAMAAGTTEGEKVEVFGSTFPRKTRQTSNKASNVPVATVIFQTVTLAKQVGGMHDLAVLVKTLEDAGME